MTNVLLVLGAVLVACAIAYFKCPKFRGVFAGVGAAIVAAVIAYVSIKELDGRGREVRVKTKAVKDGRKEAASDTQATEDAINAEVGDEEVIHRDAEAEQEALKEPSSRQRLKT